MAANEPVTELDARYSSEDATPTGWAQARERLEQAQLSWLSTVRPDGRPHVTPLLSVWLEGALYFCTGPTEGKAVRISDDAKLRRIADAYESKYGSDWHFDVHDGAFHHGPGEALVYEVAPSKAFGFGKGKYSQTRWRFDTD